MTTQATWKRVSLGEVCEFRYGKSLPEQNRIPGRHRVFGSNGPVGTHLASLTTGPTIIIGRKGSFGAIHYSDTSCWPIDTTYYVEPSSTTCDLKWLAYRLDALSLKNLNRAAAIPGLNREDAYRQELLLPPMDDQRRVAKMLDGVNCLRAKRRHAITLLDDVAQSIFRDMFSDPVNSVLGEHISFVTSGGRGWAKYYSEKGSRFIRSLDVRMNSIDNRDPVYVQCHLA